MSIYAAGKKLAFAMPLVLLAGCSSTPEPQPQPEVQPEQTQVETYQVDMNEIDSMIRNIGAENYRVNSVDALYEDFLSGLTAEQRAALTPEQLRRIKSEIEKQQRAQAREIYFDFDKYAIQSKFQAVLANHARYLASNPNTMIRLEGHADERGTPEYNIALGEKRAKAVAQILMSYGVANSQIDVISYGEERPAVMGHNDEAWAKNRRVEIKY